MHATPEHTGPPTVGTDRDDVVDAELARGTDRVHEARVLGRVVVCLGGDEEEDRVAHLDERDDGDLHDFRMDEVTFLGDDDLLPSLATLSSESLEARVSVC